VRKIKFLIAIILVLAASAAVYAQTDAELLKIAQPMMDNINKAIETKDYGKYLMDCDEGMKNALTKSKFNEFCDYHEKQLGKITSMKFFSAQKKDDMAKVTWKCKYSKTPAEFNVELVLRKVKTEWKVAGHWIKPQSPTTGK